MSIEQDALKKALAKRAKQLMASLGFLGTLSIFPWIMLVVVMDRAKGARLNEQQ